MPVLQNPKYERFAQEVAKGTPLEQAHKLAGYKPDPKNAARLTKKDAIRARIDEILTRAAGKHGVTVERITAELAKIAFADIRKAVRWGAGVIVKDADGHATVVHDIALIASDQIDDDTAAAIAEVRKTKDGLSIKFHDKQAALVNLGKNLGMFRDRVEHSGGLTINIGKEFDGL